MIYNEELYQLEDQIDELSQAIGESDLMKRYLSDWHRMNQSPEVSTIMVDFLKAKQAFEQIEAYGNHAPDFKEKRRELRKTKRVIDTNEEVAQFKFSETSLQNMLDYMCLDIAQTISDTIKVDAGNPFFEFAKRGCGGSCHVIK